MQPSPPATLSFLQEVGVARITAFVQFHHPSFEQNPEARGSSNVVRNACVVTAVKLTFLVRLSQPFDGKRRENELAVELSRRSFD